MLDAAGIPFMIVGSYASSFHGEPRMTRDIDLVVDPDEESIKILVDLIDRERFYLGDAEQALRDRSMFNLIEPASGWKIDFVIRKDRAFSVAEFDRRIPAQIGGVDVFVASVEDTMLAKLEWGAASGSDRQMSDVVSMARRGDLDLAYLERWALDLGVSDLLDRAMAEVKGAG